MPAAKPGWPVIGPTFWVCRAKSGAAFRCAKPPCAVVRFAAMTSSPRTSILPFPSRLRRAGAPTAKPRRSSAYASVSPAAKPRVRSSAPPFGFAAQNQARHFAARNRAGRSLPPPGATCSLPHFRFAQMWPRARTPALPPFRLRTSSFSAHFSAQKCPCRAMLSHSSRRGRPFALFHRAGAAFGTLTAAAAPPPSWSRRPLHIPCPPF